MSLVEWELGERRRVRPSGAEMEGKDESRGVGAEGEKEG